MTDPFAHAGSRKNLLGDNPLVGANDDRLGPRFPDMSEPYDAALRALARAEAQRQGITLREGVYVAVVGPNLASATRDALPVAFAGAYAALIVFGLKLLPR